MENDEGEEDRHRSLGCGRKKDYSRPSCFLWYFDNFGDATLEELYRLKTKKAAEKEPSPLPRGKRHKPGLCRTT